jgi:hypothetical protein
MKIHKESFYLSVTGIIIAAGALAYRFEELTNTFIIPSVVSILKLEGDPARYAPYFSPDIAFLSLFGIICLIFLRLFKEHAT